MAVQCANCGEELLGAVNRCWKCGQPLVAHAGPVDLPPVRRAPITGPLDQPANVAIEAVLVDPDKVPPSTTQRRGSPFAAPASPPPEKVVANESKVRSPKRPSGVAARVAGATSVAVGLIGLPVSYYFAPGGVLIAVAGIGFGIWGLYSTNRSLGIIGLVLSCIALAVSAFLLTVDLYIYMYGMSPFATQPLPVNVDTGQ